MDKTFRIILMVSNSSKSISVEVQILSFFLISIPNSFTLKPLQSSPSMYILQSYTCKIYCWPSFVGLFTSFFLGQAGAMLGLQKVYVTKIMFCLPNHIFLGKMSTLHHPSKKTPQSNGINFFSFFLFQNLMEMIKFSVECVAIKLRDFITESTLVKVAR